MIARLLIVFLFVLPTGMAKAGLPIYAKNFFKSCWCQKQRQCHPDFKNGAAYFDKKRGDEYQCLNCDPEEVKKPKSKAPLALQFEKLIRSPTNSCKY